VSTRIILLEIHVSYAVEVRKYHMNCRLIFESFIHYCHFWVDKGLYLAMFRSSLEEAISFKGTKSVGLVVKQL